MSIASRKALFAGTETSNRAIIICGQNRTGVADSRNQLVRVLTYLSHDRTSEYPEYSEADADISCETTPAFLDLRRSSSMSLRRTLRLTRVAPD